MNVRTWVARSFDLVAAGGYLDMLSTIYPAPDESTRPLTSTQRNAVQTALAQEDDETLIRTLLGLKKFPFNDPYVGFLRKNPQEIARSPQTTKRICGRIRSMGLDEVIEGLEQPIQMNRRMGQMFNHWLRSTYHFTPDLSDFQVSTSPLIFLAASGTELRDFANTLGCGLQKRPDFVAKAGGRYIVGEAKFIGTEGGNQNRGFEDALTLASKAAPRAIMVAVLDGIIWIPNSGQMSSRLANFAGNALTALLLNDFLTSVR